MIWHYRRTDSVSVAAAHMTASADPGAGPAGARRPSSSASLDELVVAVLILLVSRRNDGRGLNAFLLLAGCLVTAYTSL